jgi:hypothetical protein
MAGKILCPNEKCKAKIGNYDWAGVQCGCKEWIVPVSLASISSLAHDSLFVKIICVTVLRDSVSPGTRSTRFGNFGILSTGYEMEQIEMIFLALSSLQGITNGINIECTVIIQQLGDCRSLIICRFDPVCVR